MRRESSRPLRPLTVWPAQLALVSRVLLPWKVVVLTLIELRSRPPSKDQDHVSSLVGFIRTSCHDVPVALEARRRRMPSGSVVGLALFSSWSTVWAGMALGVNAPGPVGTLRTWPAEP